MPSNFIVQRAGRHSEKGQEIVERDYARKQIPLERIYNGGALRLEQVP